MTLILSIITSLILGYIVGYIVGGLRVQAYLEKEGLLKRKNNSWTERV